MGKSNQSPRGRSTAFEEGASVSATEAQNNFGRVLARVSSDGVVYITKHRRPHAVVLSVDRFEALTREERPDLDALTREFDRMMERMQSPEAAEGYNALFSTSSIRRGEAAVRGTRQGVPGPILGATPPEKPRRARPSNRAAEKSSPAKTPPESPRATSRRGARPKPDQTGSSAKSRPPRKRA